jgi:hypothetical protein
MEPILILFALMNDSCCNQEWLLKESCARNREIVKAQNSHRSYRNWFR